MRWRRRDGEIRTDTAGGVTLELGRVVDGGELASGDGAADLDGSHFGLCRAVEEELVWVLGEVEVGADAGELSRPRGYITRESSCDG